MGPATGGTLQALRGVSTALCKLPAPSCVLKSFSAKPIVSSASASRLGGSESFAFVVGKSLSKNPCRNVVGEGVKWRVRGHNRNLASVAEVAVSEKEVATGVELDAAPKQAWKASIDFKFIRDNKEAIAANIDNRKCGGNVDTVVQLYEQFVALSKEATKLRAERNVVANAMKGKLETARREELIEQGKQLKEQVADLEVELTAISEKLQLEGQRIPNMTHPDVPIGSEDVATLRKEVGSQREFSFPVKDHVELGLALDLFDFEAASEVSGTKFYYLKNEAVLLEMALISWTLSKLLPKGFVPLSTPDLVRSTVVAKCGFQPRGENTQVYSVEGTDLCLAGTAEIPVGGMYMDKMLPESTLPLKIVAFSHCFRTEAGGAGIGTRGVMTGVYTECTSSAR